LHVNSFSTSAHSVTRGERTALLPLHVLLVVAALAAAVAGQGGYYPPVRLLVSALAVTALIAALWVHGWQRDEAWPLPAACAALAGWTVVRAALDETVGAALPTVATLGCVVAVTLAVRRADAAQRQLCAAAVLGIGALVAVSGWMGVAWRVRPFALATDERLWRATSTLTYANAAAALLASLSVLSIAFLVARPRSLLRAATTYLLLVGLGATLSRAGLVAFLAGLLVLCVFAEVRAVARQAIPPVLGAAVAVAGLAPSVPVAAEPHPVLALSALVAGLVIAVCLTRLPDRIRPVALLAGVTVAGAAIVTQIWATQGMAVLNASRATPASPTRTESARAAFRLVADRPLVGVGPGRASFTWTLPDGRVVTGRYAHNEYLQVLVELGALGFALLVCVLVAVAVTVRRGRAVASSPLLWAGATAGLAALLVHSGFDFLWQLPVVPLTGALLAGLAGPTIPTIPTNPGAMEDE
jgi:hypothetical protein